jgi:hypothetical protein
MVSGHRGEQVIGPIRVNGPVGLLARVAMSAKVSVQKSWKQLVRPDRQHGRIADKHFPSPVLGRP